MKRWASLVLASLVASGCVDETTDVARGAELYETHCSMCHGEEGRGDGPVAPTLDAPPADLTRLAEGPGGFDEARVMSVIDGRLQVASHGPRDMPVWGRIFVLHEAGEPLAGPRSVLPTRALVDYLRTLQRETPGE